MSFKRGKRQKRANGNNKIVDVLPVAGEVLTVKKQKKLVKNIKH